MVETSERTATLVAETGTIFVSWTAIIAGAILAAALSLVLIAFGSAIGLSASYYVVQDVKTKKCTIIDEKPNVTEYTTVGDDGVVYKTRTEAETAMKNVKVCTTN